MEKFEKEGKEFWKRFGESFDLLPTVYFDFVSGEKYKELLEKYDLVNKKVLDLGCGFPTPKRLSKEKELAPLASEVQEILEEMGAKIISFDVAETPLKFQKEAGRKTILGTAFQLPFKDESIDGGVIILNLFNASFKGEWDEEIFITPEEVKKILEEVYRILQKGRFVIISHWGYPEEKIGGIKILGPEDKEIINEEMIKKLAQEVGFEKIKNIPLDEKRIALAGKIVLESLPLPEDIKKEIKIEIKNPLALFMEK